MSEGIVERTRRSSNTIPTLLAYSLSLLFLYVCGRAFYNVYLHPLSSYPGPKLAAATRLWSINEKLKGRWNRTVLSLHLQYGPVFRVAPDELIFTDPEAWQQIYGHRHGKPELKKDQVAYGAIEKSSIVNADKDRHIVLRKQLSHGFSERALREQDKIIRGYADLCIQRLEEKSNNGTEAVDLVQWFNFFTFDVMGDLVFGSPFNCLKDSTYHTWISTIFGSIKMGAYLQATMYFPILQKILPHLVPKDLKERGDAHQRMSEAKAADRKSQGYDRPDLMSGFLKPGSGITEKEYVSSCTLLIVAGSETTATSLSGVAYLLLAHPEKMQKVVAEVRGAFSSAAEIDLVSVNKLDYLLACLTESLRVYPPVLDSLARNTGENSEPICGRMVPPHTVLGVHHWATYHSPHNFERPEEFIPERWLDDAKFASDNKTALQPFSVGPRNCVGRNLAYFEMRLMVALLLWNFDLELQPESQDWTDQEVYILWEKKPLMVKLKPRQF